ncbi:Ig-like domain-containing protein [Solirubrobacter taibaiensis]|nr:Ig-like domain-containing protein [Solirubrobacter taibaiensis]
MRVLWVLVALLALLPVASAQAAPPTCVSGFPAAEDDGRPTRGSVGCRGPLDVPLKFEVLTRPAHGTLSEIEDRTWPWGSSSEHPQYTPTAGYRGADSFTVRATVNGESVDHVVALTVVEAVDDPPVCTTNWTNVPFGPGPAKLDAGELAYGSIQCGDDEGATLTPIVVAPPQHGVLGELKPLLIFSGASFNYRPELAHRGRDQFTLRVTDGTHIVDTILLVDVVAPTNDAPMCSPPIALDVTRADGRREVTAGTAVTLTWACGDPEGKVPVYSLRTPPAHGTATLDQPDIFGVRVNYVADAGYEGTDELTLRLQDGPHVIDFTFKLYVVPAPVIKTEDPPPAATITPVTVTPPPPATIVVGKAVKPASSPLEQRIAKACGKLKGTRKATCAKRERALAKCGAMKAGTSKQKAAKRRCTAKAKLIGATKPKRP